MNRFKAFRRTALIATLLGATGLATAATADDQGIYVEAKFGFLAQDNDDWTSATFNSTANFDGEITASGALGFMFNRFFRIEAEGHWVEPDGDTIDVFSDTTGTFGFPALGFQLEGRSRVIRTVGNAYLTFPLPYGLKPYVGGGAGWAFVNAQFTQIVPVLDTSVDPPVVFNVPTPRIRADGDDFTWQAIGGLSYEISKGIFISAEYRYMEIDRMQLGGVAGVGNVAYDFAAHTALIGLRYRFE